MLITIALLAQEVPSQDGALGVKRTVLHALAADEQIAALDHFEGGVALAVRLKDGACKIRTYQLVDDNSLTQLAEHPVTGSVKFIRFMHGKKTVVIRSDTDRDSVTRDVLLELDLNSGRLETVHTKLYWISVSPERKRIAITSSSDVTRQKQPSKFTLFVAAKGEKRWRQVAVPLANDRPVSHVWSTTGSRVLVFTFSQADFYTIQDLDQVFGNERTQEEVESLFNSERWGRKARLQLFSHTKDAPLHLTKVFTSEADWLEPVAYDEATETVYYYLNASIYTIKRRHKTEGLLYKHPPRTDIEKDPVLMQGSLASSTVSKIALVSGVIKLPENEWIYSCSILDVGSKWRVPVAIGKFNAGSLRYLQRKASWLSEDTLMIGNGRFVYLFTLRD